MVNRSATLPGYYKPCFTFFAAVFFAFVGLFAANLPAKKAWAHRLSYSGDIAYESEPRQRLDLWLQGKPLGEPRWFELSPKKLPVLIYIHGGGWMQPGHS